MSSPRGGDVSLHDNDLPIVFQIVDFFVPEADKSKKVLSKNQAKREETDYSKPPDTYRVILYGCTKAGHSVAVEVTDYCPYFYLRIPDQYAAVPKKALKQWVKDFEIYLRESSYTDRYSNTRKIVSNWYSDHLVSVKLEEKKEFMGFTNGKLFPFVKITVNSMHLFTSLKYFFQSPSPDFLKVYKEAFKLYESNLDPLLRFIHDTRIMPCGWIELPASYYSILAVGCDDDTYCRTNFTLEIHYLHLKPIENNTNAPLTIASFDIECTSSHGDFPAAIKDYAKLAKDLINISQNIRFTKAQLIEWIIKAYSADVIINDVCKIHRLYPIDKISKEAVRNTLDGVLDRIISFMDEIRKEGAGADESGDDEEAEASPINKKKTAYYETAIKNILTWRNKEQMAPCLPRLKGDAIIQIGTTVHRFGSDEIIYKNIVCLNTCDPIEGAEVECYQKEADLLYAWKEVIRRIDPDILTGYNIFGFDMPYIWARSIELFGRDNSYGIGFGRRSQRECTMIEQNLSSAALGDNILKYFDLDGVVLVDMYKVMQRTSLESYKLDDVAYLYLGDNKNDIKPHQIFEMFKGSSDDRKVIAEYCLQDCALVNRLFHKLKVLENNNAMGNVCLVPLSYLFMRGQSIKIFSLVAQFCKNENFCIPVLKNFDNDEIEDDAGYEGAIVLTPKECMYLDNAITVLDYASLYPSSMIERNLSHDAFVNNPTYDNLEGVDYMTITYDIYEGVGDKKHKVGEKACKFVQFPNNEKGVIPRILMKLLTQRKNTRKKIEYETIVTTSGETHIGLVKTTDTGLSIFDIEQNTTTHLSLEQVATRADTYNNFEKQVFDALQIAYKVTANSLYGQTGSRFSAIYLKEVAACTTATGRARIMLAKSFVEKNYTGAEVIYGDTDSIFIKFAFYDANGAPILGKETLALGIQAGKKVSKDIKSIMPAPQSLEYEKTMFPFIIFSKKRYVGLLYEDDATKKPKLKSMGIVLKRRDNANIVKKIYGGIIDILLYKYDLQMSVDFLQAELRKLVKGEYPIEDLIITKTISGHYKDRSKIAHAVLADRMGERGDEKPQINDRVPYVYIDVKDKNVKLQSDRIEHPDYIKAHNITPDYQFYITNQLQKPICQIFALCVEKLPNYAYPPSYWDQTDEELRHNKIYGDNDMKRHTRVIALKQKEAAELLFCDFIEKKARAVRAPGAKKTVIQKYTLSLESPTITLKVSEDKSAKTFKGTFEFLIKNQSIIKKDIVVKKPSNLTKTEGTTQIMIEVIKLLLPAHKDIIETEGIVLKLDVYYTRTLKVTLEEHEDIMDKLDAANKAGDFNEVAKYTEMLQSFKIAKIIYKYKHMFA
jgi:DNA polymerase delta subunit 1